MFSGITETKLTIQRITTSASVVSVIFKRPRHRCVLGGSVLVQGICSTIAAITKTTITVQYMPETLRCTTVSEWKVGQQCNAEWPITLQTELSGSIISGHVDAIAAIGDVKNNKRDYIITIVCPKKDSSYLLPKGGITIDGVNLTIQVVQKNILQVHLIPYTLQHTTLNSLRLHDKVNLEYDYITKIVCSKIK